MKSARSKSSQSQLRLPLLAFELLSCLTENLLFKSFDDALFVWSECSYFVCIAVEPFACTLTLFFMTENLNASSWQKI